jgi:hypothetical protein
MTGLVFSFARVMSVEFNVPQQLLAIVAGKFLAWWERFDASQASSSRVGCGRTPCPHRTATGIARQIRLDRRNGRTALPTRRACSSWRCAGSSLQTEQTI